MPAITPTHAIQLSITRPKLPNDFPLLDDSELLLWSEERAEQEHQRAEQERQRAERLAERLRQLGVEPE